MSGFRVFLIVLALCVVVGAGVGYTLWKTLGPAAVDTIRKIETDASEFAAANDQAGCVSEAFRRSRACDGVICEVTQPAFARECLSRAAQAEALCDGVPDSVVRGALWTQTACVDIDDVRPEVCSRILREVLKVCVARGS